MDMDDSNLSGVIEAAAALLYSLTLLLAAGVDGQFLVVACAAAEAGGWWVLLLRKSSLALLYLFCQRCWAFFWVFVQFFFDALLGQYGIFVGTHCPTACIAAALASASIDLAVGDVEVFLLLLLVDVDLTEVYDDDVEVDESPRADDNWTLNWRWCP